MRVETINRQDRLRFYSLVGIAHSASRQLSQILSDIEALLRAEPLVSQDTVSVRFVALTDSAMNVEVGAMFETIDGNRFADARQRILFGIVRVVEEAGAQLAHPTRNVEILPRSRDLGPSAEAAPASNAASVRQSSERLSLTG